MDGFDEATQRLPNDRDMARILKRFHGTMQAGATGWSRAARSSATTAARQ